MSKELSMNEVALLFNFIKTSANDSSVTVISTLLETEKNQKVVIAYINKLLKSSQWKDEAYEYLNTVIFCLSRDIISENIVFWLQNTVEYCKYTEATSNGYTILSNLIHLGKTNQDFNKLMVSSVLFKILEECLSAKLQSNQAQNALLCMAICLEEYPQSCISFKNKIESYLLQCLHLQTENIQLIKNASLCFLNIQKIGNSGTDHRNHMNNWQNSFERLFFTMDMLYDTFFGEIEELYAHGRPAIEQYNLPDIPKIVSQIKMQNIVENRLENICTFLRGMLENEFTVAKCINPQYVLAVITRSLSLHICGNKSDENLIEFSALFIKHQISLLYVLRSVIAVLELSLLPYSGIITKLLVDCLARTKKCNCFNHTSNYKEVVYKVLEYWIEILKNCLTRNVHNKIVNLIIDDISPITIDVALNISNLNSTSRKKEKQLMQEKIIASTSKSSNIRNYSKNILNTKEKVCYRALCCLLSLLRLVYLIMEEATMKKLYTTLTQAILSLQCGKVTIPYKNEKVQIKLYEALTATIECSKPPSIGLIANLLRQGGKSSNTSIKLTCCTGLRLIEKICQPTTPSWNFVNLSDFSTSNSTQVEFSGEINSISIKLNETDSTYKYTAQDEEMHFQASKTSDTIEDNTLKNGCIARIDATSFDGNNEKLQVQENTSNEQSIKPDLESQQNASGSDIKEKMVNEKMQIKVENSIKIYDLHLLHVENVDENLETHVDRDIDWQKITNSDCSAEKWKVYENEFCTEEVINKDNNIENESFINHVENPVCQLNGRIEEDILNNSQKRYGDDDNDCEESMNKKSKIDSSPQDINEMLNSFVSDTDES